MLSSCMSSVEVDSIWINLCEGLFPLYVHEHLCPFRCCCIFYVPLPSPPYKNTRVCMRTQPQFLHCLCVHCMPTCSPACARCACVSFVSVRLYTHKCMWWWDLVVWSSSPCKNGEQWREKMGVGNVFNSLVWKLPVGWAEAAGREWGSSQQRRRKKCVHMFISERRQREGEGDQERWGVCSSESVRVLRIWYSVQSKQIHPLWYHDTIVFTYTV